MNRSDKICLHVVLLTFVLIFTSVIHAAATGGNTCRTRGAKLLVFTAIGCYLSEEVK